MDDKCGFDVQDSDVKENNSNTIEPGMIVEATEGDLGEEDVSKPKVTGVVQDEEGNVQRVVVTKGVLFKKRLEVPAKRVQQIEPPAGEVIPEGKVTIDASQAETASLKAVGDESLAPETQHDLLDKVELQIPTSEGLREKEYGNLQQTASPTNKDSLASANNGTVQQAVRSTRFSKRSFFLHVLGPGFIGGMSGNDSSAVTAYAVDGATVGYTHLWLMLLSTFMYQSVQYACAKIGRITHEGLSGILRVHYGRGVAFSASLVLIIANVALISADLVAIGSGLELVTTIPWYWFVVPIALCLWYLTVYRNFETIKKVFIVMSLAFVTYIITALFSGADWRGVLFHTFVPLVTPGFVGISSAVALLGATISPYSMFWQAQGEKEEQRTGPMKKQLRNTAIDVAIGVISGNLVSYFIIICTASTLFAHHQNVNTAADAARSLEPLLGPYAQYLFAIGLIGAGLIAIPVLLASTSYAVAGAFGWPAGLSKKPWQNEGFYLILTAALIVSLIVALLRFDPIQLIFWANVLSGILAPILVIYIFIVGNNRKIMRDQRLGLITNIGLVVTILTLMIGIIFLFYGLLTGQGGS